MQKNFQSMIVNVLRNQTQQNPFTFIISSSSTSNSGQVIKKISQQPNEIVYQVQSLSRITPELFEETVEVNCYKDGNHYIFPREEFDHLMNEINNEGDSQESQSDEESNSSEEESESDSENGSNEKNSRKGRGRPKGSKNKKTLMKEQEQGQKYVQYNHSMKHRRGKGRPKGSKNKPKNKLDATKQENQSNPPFGKRGKGRPKGSKNKIKIAEQIQIPEENQIKRGRGRPKGAKNKQNSSQDISVNKEESEESEKKQYIRVPIQEIQNIYCCERCYQRYLKKKIYEGEYKFEEVLSDMSGLCDDFSLENKQNFFLEALETYDEELLIEILKNKDKQVNFFKTPWQTERAIEKTRFETRTKKEFLSKTGKEGIYALLHDSSYKKQIWWKKIGIQRIIQSIPYENPQQILDILLQNNEDLKEELYNNLPAIMRCGKDTLASIILKQILSNPSSNKYNYSSDHLDLLQGNPNTLGQLKKFNLIKHNDGSNFFSPIHCAAITSSKDFLNKLLQFFTDIINKGDSFFRKPIHYASASRNPENLKALVQHGAQLKEIDRRKTTPLMIACQQGINENVEYILEKTRDPYYIIWRNDEGYTALHYAVLKDEIKCLQTLLNDRFFYELKEEVKEVIGELFYLVSGTGNLDIFRILIDKVPSFLSTSFEKNEKFRRTPLMFAIRNHNNELLYQLLEEGCKHSKSDSTENTLLHYAAAYGNVEAILLFRNIIEQSPNKRGYYPWEFAIMKGHLGCAKLLQDCTFQFKKHDPLYLLLTQIRGTREYLDCVRYIEQKFTENIHYQEEFTDNGYLHLVCAIGQQDYVKIRSLQTNLTEEQIREQYNFMQKELIDFFQSKKLDGYLENKKRQTPLKLCIQNTNLIGFQKLLTGKINFDVQSGDGSTIMHRLSNLACRGIQQMLFVQGKLKEAGTSDLRINLKKIDQNGFDFLLYFVKNFTETIKDTFHKSKKRFLKEGKTKQQAENDAFVYFVKFEKKFMKLVDYLIMDLGCDINGQVMDKRNNCQQSYKKWGIQHFLMKFPSLSLVKFFKSRIRDFNAQNNDGMTPLHLFCKNVFDGNLLDAQGINIPKQYEAQIIIEHLLSNGLNPNTKDSDRSYPILYAALNHQYKFIMILLKHKSQINSVNLKNQVPFIQIIKNHRNYTLQQIQSILKYVKPNFEDREKRTALHHLVACSSNFDQSPEVFKLLLGYGFKINALDQYNRSPIFYCFDPDDDGVDEPNDKVELLQVMMNLSQINLNLLDLYKRSLVHYACRKNYFFSILYLLDKNINFEIKDHEDNTPLGVCLKHRNLDQAALIIKKGIRCGYVNEVNEKLSYFAYAIKNLSVGICFMLLDHGYPIQKALQEVENEAFKEILKKKYIR